MSNKHLIKQVFVSYYDKENNLIRELPDIFYKYDNSGNKIIEISFIYISPLSEFFKTQYTLKNYDNKNNLKSEITFFNFSKELYGFGKIINYDDTVSFSKNEITSKYKYINKYNNNGELIEVEQINLKDEKNEFELKRYSKLINKKFYYEKDLLVEIKSTHFNYYNEKTLTTVVQFKYDEDGNQIEKIEKGEYFNHLSNEEGFEKLEESSNYFDDDNNQIKEIKFYNNGNLGSKQLHMRDKIEYYGESDSTPYFTKEITYENKLKKLEITHGFNVNSYEDEYYKVESEFKYDDSKYFEDKWLKMLFKGFTDIEDDWNFNNWYN